MSLLKPPATHRIGAYAATIDERIAAVVVTLDMHADHARDDIEFYPRVVDVTDSDGRSLDLSAVRMDRLANIAWDVVEERHPRDRADAYRVTIRPAVGAFPVEAGEL